MILLCVNLDHMAVPLPTSSEEQSYHKRKSIRSDLRKHLSVAVPQLRSITVASNDPGTGSKVYFDVALQCLPSQSMYTLIKETLRIHGYKSVQIDDEIENAAEVKTPAASRLFKQVFNLAGLTCKSCSENVKAALESLQGVYKVNVSLHPQVAVVEFNPLLLSVKNIEQKIVSTGYGVTNSRPVEYSPQSVSFESTSAKASFILSGLTCASCVASLEHVLQSTHGIGPVSVTLLPQKAVVSFNPYYQSVDTIASIIDVAGFDVLSSSSESDKGKKADQQATVSQIELIIDGMTCAACVMSIENALHNQQGVRSATVNLLTRKAVISYDVSKTGLRDLIKFIDDIGFEASFSTEVLSQNNQAEAQILHRHFKEVIAALFFAIPAFFISMVVMMMLPSDNVLRRYLMQEVWPGLSLDELIMALIATPVQFVLGARFYIGSWKSVMRLHSANMDVLVALGTTIAYLFSVYALAFNICSGEHIVDQFFETSIFLIFFILFGKYLEAFAKGKTSEAISHLVSLAPSSATLVELENGDVNRIIKTEEIQLALVQVGDVLRVAAGARFPCDGVILSGISYVDESMLTGESIPVCKGVGDSIMGGTINKSAIILMKVMSVGADTTLARIIKMVEDAQSNKAPVQAYADKISSVFVPTVMGIALVTFIAWYSLFSFGVFPSSWIPERKSAILFSAEFAISVLVIACPCSLGLATPTAVMVGTGLAAKYGILVKGGGAALELSHKIKAIAFDKTGTLTYGKPTVSDFHLTNVPKKLKSVIKTPEDFWSLVWRLESSSDHPLAVAVCDYIKSEMNESVRNHESMRGYTVEEVNEIAGKGLVGVLRNASKPKLPAFRVFCGNKKFLVESGCMHEEDDSILNAIERWQMFGQSVVLVGVSPVVDVVDAKEVSLPSTSSAATGSSFGHILGAIAVSDQIRNESADVIDALEKRGIAVWMITGDNDLTARSIAQKLRIKPTQVISQVLPSEKSAQINRIQAQVRSNGKQGNVAMVGDGINDSVALAQADVGIAIGAGSDIAIEAAQVVLVKSDLRDVLILAELSKKTFNRVKLNFVWALAYNVLGIPIAAGLFYPMFHVALAPWIAGLAMAMSSVSVIASSLALRMCKFTTN